MHACLNCHTDGTTNMDDVVLQLWYKPSLSQTARLLVSILDEVVTAFVEDMDNVVLGTM